LFNILTVSNNRQFGGTITRTDKKKKTAYHPYNATTSKGKSQAGVRAISEKEGKVSRNTRRILSSG
jgi:hypothetical protein